MKIRKPERVDIIPAVAGTEGRESIVLCSAGTPDASPNPGRGAGTYITLCVTPLVEFAGIKIQGPTMCTTVWSPTGG